jgi:hypothetical protein
MGGVGKAGLALAMMAVLAGCSSAAKDAPESAASAPAVGDGRCDAQGAQFAVGQQASKALLEQAKTRSGSMMARTLGPHDSITMDYRSERLNLNTDDSGKVIRANCG